MDIQLMEWVITPLFLITDMLLGRLEITLGMDTCLEVMYPTVVQKAI
jgi:hypothetical protein